MLCVKIFGQFDIPSGLDDIQRDAIRTDQRHGAAIDIAIWRVNMIFPLFR